MQRYEKYKDSGVEWIGEIPEGWEVKRFKYLFDLITEKINEDLHKIGLENIESESGKLIQTDTKFEGDGVRFKPGDILFGKLRPYLAKVYLTDFSGLAVGDFFIFRSQGEIFENFGSKIILSKRFIEVTNGSTFGSKMPRVSWDFISNLEIAYPPKPDQVAIANYLDRKTAEIDELIAQKERLLELYEEEKTAIINQAVTKGIDLDDVGADLRVCPGAKGEHAGSPLRDSGIDWLGEIPERWRVSKLKYLVEVKDGTHDTPSYIQQSENSYPLVTSKDIKSGKIDFSECKHISSVDFDSINKRSNVVKNDIIMPMIGTVGGAVVVETDEPFSIKNVALFKASSSNSIPLYIKYLIESLIVKKQFDLESRGGVQDFVSLNLLKNIIVFKIQKEDQAAIVHHIETETARINAKIAKTKRIIELQKEYRTALISEVVTGKIKVTEEAAS